MVTAAHYHVYAVCPGGILRESMTVGAPTESKLIQMGRARRASFVIRYFPSRKGWRVLDIRDVREFAIGGSTLRRKFTGAVRGKTYYPTHDAAIMVAIHKLARHNITG